MADPIGTRRVSCSAHDGPRQCRAYRNLTAVLIQAPEAKGLILPEYLVIMLCPKHFVFKSAAPQEEKRG